MFSHLLMNEIHTNVLNFRFSVSVILNAVLILVCVIVMTGKYERDYNDYLARIDLQDEFLNDYAHQNRVHRFYIPEKPPVLFSTLINSVPVEFSQFNQGLFKDPFPLYFPHVDLIFIVTIVMGLMAILFSYNAVTGERENGTLRLIMSNTVSRPVLICAKWLGGLISLILPFLVTLHVGVLYLVLHPAVKWDSMSFTTFYLLVAASILFISIMYLVGLMISSIASNSSASLLISLFIWVIFILIIPNLAPYVAAQAYRIPSVTQHEWTVNRMLDEERDELGRSLMRNAQDEMFEKYGQPYRDYLNMGNESIRKRIADDPPFKGMHEENKKVVDDAFLEANRIQREKVKALSTDYNNRVMNQNIIARNITCISPYASFRYLAGDLTGTGLHEKMYFETLLERWQQLFNPYFNKKEAEAKAADPMYDSDTFIDLSDRPGFSYVAEPLMSRMNVVKWHWVILGLFNVLFFTTAFVSFLRCDVR